MACRPLRLWGAPVFGFTAIHDIEDKHRTELALTSFAGDPHAYTAQLGDTTALALCGQRRIVLGLSATAHMPGGTMHHLITPPPGTSPTTSPAPSCCGRSPCGTNGTTPSGSREPPTSTGTRPINRWAAHSWSQHIVQHLKKLASRPATAHRARILVACTSYVGAAQLAEGMISAGADPK